MGIFENNLKVLEKYDKNLFNMVNSLGESDSNEFNIYFNENNQPVLEVKNEDGNYVQYTSYFDPLNEAKELTANINYDLNRSTILIMGTGLGYIIDEVLKNLNEKTMVLVVEKDIYIFRDLMKVRDISWWFESKKVVFAIGEFDNDRFKDILGNLVRKMSLNMMNIQPVLMPVYDMKYIKYFNNILPFINRCKDMYFFGIGNDLDDTLVGIKNRFDNLHAFIKNPGLNQFLKEYGDIYKDKPAIIVASGPSLNKNIKDLKKAVGKALILSCDASVQTLLNNGIVPNSMGSVERAKITYEKFYDGKRFPDEIVLTSPAVVRKEIIDTFPNKFLSFFKKGEVYAEWFNKAAMNKGTVWCGASVAHALYGLAHELGCNPIILIGQDLAYGKDGNSHAKEASVNEKTDLEKVDIFVKGINGEMLPSTYIWVKFLDMYEAAIRNSDRIIIDATEGGALIEGTKVMNLNDAIEKYCISEIPSLRSLIDKLNVDQEFEKKANQNVIKNVKRVIKRFGILNKRVQIAIKDNKSSLNRINKGITMQKQLDKLYDSIDYTENKIVKKVVREPILRMMFQYPIYGAASKINALGTKFDLDSLKKNLEIQNELLRIFELYSRKTLRVFYDGLENFLEPLNIEIKEVLKEYDWIYPLISQIKFDIE